MYLKDNERIDDLEYKDLKIIQNNKQFCFGIDSVLLSDFAKDLNRNDILLDLGTGNGILGILLCAKTDIKKVIGIEKQEDVADLTNRNIILNHLEDRFEVRCMDINNILSVFKNNSIDAIVTNPPYKKKGTGKINTLDYKTIARHETSASLEDFIKVSFKVLKDKGSFYMVHKAERMIDIIYLLRKYKLEPKTIRFVHSHRNEKPELILIKSIKNANSYLKIKDPLYIYEDDGEYTKEILKIYNK